MANLPGDGGGVHRRLRIRCSSEPAARCGLDRIEDLVDRPGRACERLVVPSPEVVRFCLPVSQTPGRGPSSYSLLWRPGLPPGTHPAVDPLLQRVRRSWSTGTDQLALQLALLRWGLRASCAPSPDRPARDRPRRASAVAHGQQSWALQRPCRTAEVHTSFVSGRARLMDGTRDRRQPRDQGRTVSRETTAADDVRSSWCTTWSGRCPRRLLGPSPRQPSTPAGTCGTCAMAASPAC
jgi:hypothetical protein